MIFDRFQNSVRVLLTVATFLSATGAFASRPAFANDVLPSRQAGPADVTVTINPLSVVRTSKFANGLTHIDDSLLWANSGSIQTAKSVVAQTVVFQNVFLMAWGTANPWPDPAQANPTHWGNLDSRIGLVLETGGTPIITLVEAPWWMKGQRQADGTTKLIPDIRGDFSPYTYTTAFTDYRGFRYPAGYVSPSPISARVLDSHMSKWLKLVEATAQRYMAPPYNVRYFQVWNELKGYYNPITNNWDYTTSAGNTSGYWAEHGYTYMYNQVYQRIKQVAANLGIPANQVNVGGPYVGFKTWSSATASGYATTEPLLMNKAYGTYDQRDVDVIKYWLQNRAGAEFIVWDGGTKNREGTNLADPYVASEKFRDTLAWLRGLDPAQYPGADTLPLSYAEWYAFPYDTTDRQVHNSVKTYAAMLYIKAGGWLTLLWGGEESDDLRLNPSFYTETGTSGGGHGLPWASSYQALKQHFGAGTPIVQTTQSSSNLGVLASPLKTMLVNKTGGTLTVAVNAISVTLHPWQVLILDTPGGGPTPTRTPTATRTPGPTATRTSTVVPSATFTPSPTANRTVVDTTKPEVLITNPANLSRVTVNTTVHIHVTVTDNVAVSEVNVFINDTLFCSDLNGCPWRVPAGARITYTIRVQAIDTSDNRTNRTIQVTSGNP
jgi:hypothetical protein